MDANDHGYHTNERTRNAMTKHGMLSFRICVQEMRLPSEYLAKLLKNPSETLEKECSRSEALDFWLLSQLLMAIGGHSML